MLIATDFAATLRFYQVTLGLDPSSGPWASPYAELTSEGCRLVILEGRFWASTGAPGIPPAPEPCDTVVLAIRVGDVDADHRRLAAAGVAFVQPPSDRPMMGLRNALLRDPDGRLVELTTRLAPKPRPA